MESQTVTLRACPEAITRIAGLVPGLANLDATLNSQALENVTGSRIPTP